VERILERHPDIAAAAVYAVPDPRSGDQVMTAVELRPARRFDPEGFARFLGEQGDLGTKWPPRFVRVTPALPLTATGKITKTTLGAEGWWCADPVYWSPGRGAEVAYRSLSEADRRALEDEFARHGREHLLGARARPVARGGAG
jgi:fatty-acyl-CoA synthase